MPLGISESQPPEVCANSDVQHQVVRESSHLPEEWLRAPALQAQAWVSTALQEPRGESDFLARCLGLLICKVGSREAETVLPHKGLSAAQALVKRGPTRLWPSCCSSETLSSEHYLGPSRCSASHPRHQARTLISKGSLSLEEKRLQHKQVSVY